MTKQEIRFVLMAQDGSYVGVDESSGGYPWYPDSLFRAKFWSDKGEALKYAHTFKDEGWTLHTLKFDISSTYVSKAELAEARGDKDYAEYLRLARIYGATGEATCVFSECWVGRCKVGVIPGEEFCGQHLGKKCWACDEQAISNCESTMGAFVCGVYQCEKHPHRHG